MPSFLSAAAKKSTDIRGFLREAAGNNSIKYAPEVGARHTLYIPYKSITETHEDGSEELINEVIAISGSVHEWTGTDGKYKATVCAKGQIIKDDNGNILNDGSCPFCDRVEDAWAIYNYRKDLELRTCGLVGEELDKHMKAACQTYGDERKAKDARSYLYLLVAKFRMKDASTPVMGSDGLPEFDLRVMKMSASRVEKIQQQVANSGAELPGSELMIQYPNNDDRRLLVSQSTTAPVFPQMMLTHRYPDLVNKIKAEVAKFSWEGIEKSFPEWSGMTTLEAKKVTDTMFEMWDKYKKDVELAPATQYMEYITSTPVTNPSLDASSTAIPTAPAVPTATAIPDISTISQAPTAPAVPTAPTVPGANAVDPNSVFGGASTEIKI